MLTLAIIALFAAQFHPKGQAFLATDLGAFVVVALSIVAIVAMLPGVLFGNVLNLLLIGMWGYMAYPRVGAAKRWLVSNLRSLRLPR